MIWNFGVMKILQNQTYQGHYTDGKMGNSNATTWKNWNGSGKDGNNVAYWTMNLNLRGCKPYRGGDVMISTFVPPLT